MTLNHLAHSQTPTKSSIKKVLILGAECTGKSTLAKDLATHFHTRYVPEYMRTYLENKPKNYVCQYEDLLPIALGQLQSECDNLQKSNQYLFCDTSTFEIMAYALWYFNKCPKEIIAMIDNNPYDLILLTDESGIDWQADDMRDLPHGRTQMREHFITLLEEFHLPFHPISGNRTQRIHQVHYLLQPNSHG